MLSMKACVDDESIGHKLCCCKWYINLILSVVNMCLLSFVVVLSCSMLMSKHLMTVVIVFVGMCSLPLMLGQSDELGLQFQQPLYKSDHMQGTNVSSNRVAVNRERHLLITLTLHTRPLDEP